MRLGLRFDAAETVFAPMAMVLGEIGPASSPLGSAAPVVLASGDMDGDDVDGFDEDDFDDDFDDDFEEEWEDDLDDDAEDDDDFDIEKGSDGH